MFGAMPSDDPALLTDDKRETQLLFQEKVLIHENPSGNWVRIEAIEQPEFTHHNRWEGYPGWIQNKIFMAARQSRRISASRRSWMRRGKCSGHRLCLGQPCPPGAAWIAQGLVHLGAIRVNGLKIPRDAHEQWMKSTKDQNARSTFCPAISCSRRKARSTPRKVTRMSPCMQETTCWSEKAPPERASRVRDISFQEEFVKPLKDVESGQTVGERVIYFGHAT